MINKNMSNLQVSDWVTLLSMNEARKLERERMREGVSLFILILTRKGSRMKKIGVLLPTRSQLPSSV